MNAIALIKWVTELEMRIEKLENENAKLKQDPAHSQNCYPNGNLMFHYYPPISWNQTTENPNKFNHKVQY